jgi:hypothetical protein
MKIPWQERKKTIRSQSLSLFFFISSLFWRITFFHELVSPSPKIMLKPKYVVA